MNSKKGKNFWNEAAKWGLFIGVVMGVSKMLEYSLMLSGSVTKFSLLTVEWVVVAVAFVVMLYRAVRSRAVEVYDVLGFSFGRCVNYALIISMFASVIVSVLSHIYVNSVVGGYDVYIKELVTSVTTVMNEAQVDSAVMNTYAQTFEDLKNSPVAIPSIFDTFLSTLSIYILAGTSVGLIVSFFVKHYVKKQFGNE